MSGVFLSYTRADSALAVRLLHALRALGVEVWWDQDMEGVDWQQELERRINTLSAVVVLWTPNSEKSKYVRDEARLALQSEKLINTLMGIGQPPFPFERINGLPLDGWSGQPDHGGWRRLVQTTEEHLERSGAIRPGALTAELRRQDELAGMRRAALAEAEEALAACKAEEDDAAAVEAQARNNLEEAEAELGRLLPLGVRPAILRAAQGEVDAAGAAVDEAVRARKATAARTAHAVRTLTQAKAEPAPAIAPAPPPPPVAPPPEPARPDPPPEAVVVKPATPMPSRAVLTVAAVAVAAVALVALLIASSNKPPPAAPAAAAAPESAADVFKRVVAHDWEGNGAVCKTAPLRFRITQDVIIMTLLGTSSDGTVGKVGPDGRISAQWPDGAWYYAVTGDTLTMTPPQGEPMTFTRCPA